MLVARTDADIEVGRVKGAAERVGVLSKDEVTHIVDKVVFVDGDESRGGVRAPDPDLASHHVGVYGE